MADNINVSVVEKQQINVTVDCVPNVVQNTDYTNVVAGMTLHGHRVVCVKADGKVYEVDINNEDDIRNVLGVTTGAVNANEIANIQTSGTIKLVGWGLTLGEQYVQDGGIISHTLPTTYIRKIGVAIDSNTLLIQNNIIIER